MVVYVSYYKDGKNLTHVKKIKIRHWNNQDLKTPNRKMSYNTHPEQYKTQNNIDKLYKEHKYLLWYGNRRNDDQFVVLLKIMLKKQALNVKVYSLR